MTDQPSALAAEVERIRVEVSKQFEHVANRDHCLTLLAHIAAQSAELQRLQSENRALHTEADRIEQELGNALGYPWYIDDKKIFPDATDEDGVCVGECTAASLASEAAARIGSLQSELAALRRPVVESEEVGRIRTRQKERDSDRDSYGTYSQEQKLEAVYDCWNMLLQYDAVQHQIRELIANHEKREDQMEEEIARLSSPPEERPEIVERQAERRNILINTVRLSPIYVRVALQDIDTLLQDSARWRSAHTVLLVELNAAREREGVLREALAAARATSKESTHEVRDGNE